ncbi:hypothetical protein CPAST_c19780 [Clostridium pasteurianum DSM 525 = ATCC 6013]|uniref:Uncharacterized protein n=1 Tax=Clostridium pasteurianum DSM 525 = ATCC 6013 TaxID=1262449 RepID=A0A0H3J816_CLOPA|nr:hypothetical protein [Clostridium pasteurianum]AJA48048.1 hypothetical protein CPAST_c19780 [Clostridium pasteurianum DSM 525 = ATCC 6013]AJA52036.1 hypothetical protein CLPA_c19780 [Clostridium pasteurianum DSM 525 = ATCC 6013]KRU11954.1 hypothetical protein CP6013_01201 [Clostridium pasteurianum DSM 525 = ATCC 6013]
MEKYIGDVILSVAILIGLIIICNSKHPIEIQLTIKDLHLKIGSKRKEDK